MVRPLWKIVWQLLKWLNKELTHDPTISLLGKYPKEVKTYVHTVTCVLMFIGALFIIAPN